MTTKTTIKTVITLRANEWFDKANGNSYHNALLTIVNTKTGEITKYQSGMQYGYDSAYVTTCGEMLVKLGLIDDEQRNLGWQVAKALEAKGIKLAVEGIHCGLKRDLLTMDETL